MRAVCLVIDAFGIGAQPDAADYGDVGANTLASISKTVHPLLWPHLLKLGLGNAAAVIQAPIEGCEPSPAPEASFGAMQQQSQGKDTTTGHWEIAGIVLKKPFHRFPPAYPSFPPELVLRFEQETGFRILGNCSVSGTTIIEELGQQQMEGKHVIAYTSADSVFQIAAHEEVVPLAELYRICEIARRICDDYDVARVIARPFVGRPGSFKRTAGRHDYSIALPGPSVLDHLGRHGVEIVGVGKIGDIFNHQGVEKTYSDKSNTDCSRRVLELLAAPPEEDQFIFVNLVETDMLYGHRRDIQGYHDAVGAIDKTLPAIMAALASDDLLIITSDHGCDPGFRGTDHTREYVPLLVYQPLKKKGLNLGIRSGFSDVAQSICDYFDLPPFGTGTSFLNRAESS